MVNTVASASDVWSQGVSEASFIENVFKLIHQGTFWAKYCNPGVSESIVELGTVTKQAATIIGVADLPSKIQKFIAGYQAEGSSMFSFSTLSAGTAVLSAAKDTAELANTFFISIPATTMTALKGTSSVGSIVVSGKSLYDIISQPSSGTLTPTARFLKVASLVSHISLGVFGVASLFMKVAVPVMLGLATLATGLAIATHFEKNIHSHTD